jgi:SOS-response transcriptional repressor LexA
MRMELGAMIRQRRTDLGLTQDQVAQRAGISKPYLSNIETGRASNPPSDQVLRSLERALEVEAGHLRRLAHLARTPVDIREEHERLAGDYQRLRAALSRLLDGAPRTDQGELDVDSALREMVDDAGPAVGPGRVVPIINKVAAGYPQEFTDLDYPVSIADEYVRCPGVSDPQAFAARIVGDSMQPDYTEGDIVVFSPNTRADSGDDCFVRFEGGDGTTFKRVYQDDPQSLRLQPLNNTYPAQTVSLETVTGLWPAVLRIQKLRRPTD